MRDGVTLSLNIYKPQSAGKFPALLNLHPYCKDNLPQNGKVPFQYRVIRQTGQIAFSEETSWEAPDPDFWVKQGYVIINIDKGDYGNTEFNSFLTTTESLKFSYIFPQDTEVIGPMKLTLFVSLESIDDANLFIGIQKFHNRQEVNFEGSYGFANHQIGEYEKSAAGKCSIWVSSLYPSALLVPMLLSNL